MATPIAPEELRKNRPVFNASVDLFAPQTPEQQRQQRYTEGVFNPGVTPQTQQQAQVVANAVDPAGTGAGTINTGQAIENAVANADWRDTLLSQYNEANEYYNNLLKQNEQAQRAEKSRRTIGAVADAIAGIANMWGTSKGAYNQQNPKAYKMISDNIVRDRQIRQNNINTANRRLDDLAKALNTAGYRQANLDFKGEELKYKQGKESRLNEQGAAKIKLMADRIQASIDNNIRSTNARIYASDNSLQGKLASVNATNCKTTTQANTEAAKIAAKAGEAAAKEVEENNKKIISELADKDNIAITRDEIGEAMYGPKQNWSAEQIVNVGNMNKSDIEKYANAHPEWAAKKGIKPVPGKGGGASASSTTSSPSKPSPNDYKGGGSQSKKDKINSFKGGK